MKFNPLKFRMVIILFSLLLMSGLFVASFQGNVSKANSFIASIIVNLPHLDFGLVFPGEQLQKTFIVSYSDAGNGDGSYTIVEKYKPFDPVDSDYCQINYEDYTRCYKTLCPYMTEYIEYSEEGEGDDVGGASVGPNDLSDIWIVDLDVPAIMGNVAQDHTGGIVTENGIYGCDLSFNVEDTEIKSSISGCKYNDINNNGVIDEDEKELKLSGWEIQLISCPYLSEGNPSFPSKDGIGSGLPGSCVVMQTTTTIDGCYSFDNLSAGDYGVAEADKDNWTQTYPVDNTFYYFPLGADKDKTNIDFANFTDYQEPHCGNGILESGEQCDDGNNIDNDECSNSCIIKRRGGGGGVLVSLQINNAEDCVAGEDGTYFSWKTNMTSSSRVVCDTEPNSDWGTPPDYGYYFFTDEFNLSPRILNHEVKIEGLVPGESYYCRIISSSSSSTVFEEVICSIPEEEEEEGEVKGESDVIIPEALPKTGYGNRN